MSVCQYYLNGHCRYGDRCRLSHEASFQPRTHYPDHQSIRPRVTRAPIDSIYTYVAPSATNQNHRVENRCASGRENLKFMDVFKWVKETFTNNERALDILGEIQREAKVWQRSEHLWRFTSRSLFPGGQPLPDWHDQSFEEMKWSHRFLTSQNQEHVYKKAFNDYYETIVRHLHGLGTLKLDRLKLLKEYIDQYIASNHKPSKTLATDVEMKDVDAPITMKVSQQTDSTNYTPDDQLLEDERAAFQSDEFQFGHFPAHPPSQQLC